MVALRRQRQVNLSLRPAWSSMQVPGQPVLHSVKKTYKRPPHLVPRAAPGPHYNEKKNVVERWKRQKNRAVHVLWREVELETWR